MSAEECHHAMLGEGRLRYQQCLRCGNSWLPQRPQCPSCLADAWEWCAAAGGGTLISFVVYHHAFHEDVKDLVPYAVGIVELDEGPRMLCRLGGVTIDPGGEAGLTVGQSMKLVWGMRNGATVPLFEPRQ